MLFNSFEFAVFFPTVVLAYFLLPHRHRWRFLLISSCIFYAFFVPKYLLILAITILVDYFAGIYIEKSEGRRKKSALIISIVVTGVILGVFKYYNFFIENVSYAMRLLGVEPHLKTLEIILPIGLSFHTFQSMSYVIEVYRGNQKAERHFGIYSLYVMFFPQLVAGPIERPQNLLPQFLIPKHFDFERTSRGLALIAWGLFKKVVIADNLALFVNLVYDSPREFSGITLILGTAFFAFQIYCDFSGYSDIAIGTAEILGFKLMKNFRRPYFSSSISEFWTRWHISLSTWFKDYLYIPLGGSRRGLARWQLNLLVTFLVSGFWHGANWTYIIWGGMNGIYLVTENFIRASPFQRIRIPKLILQLGVFILICFTWIFFRTKNVSDGWYVLTHLFDRTSEILSNVIRNRSLMGQKLLPLPIGDFLYSLGLIFTLISCELLQERRALREWVFSWPRPFRWALYYAGVLLLYCLGIYGKNQFIYFQF